MLFCPQCGTKLQAGDQFCHQCGQPINPADPTQRLGAPATPAPAATQVYESWSQVPQAPPVQSVPPRPQYAPPYSASNDGQNWVSGSSFPSSNPYGGTPNTVSPGTMLNGRPIGGRQSKGILQGLGGAIALALVLLGKFGGAIASLGLFKLLGLFWLFNWIGHGHSWVAIIVLLLIVAAVWRQLS
jgi:hypothetical protein